MKGVDISNYQAGLDLTRAKSAGIEFAICKISEVCSYKDRQFDTFYQQAQFIGLPLGAYVYSHATTAYDAVAEARYALNLLHGRPLCLGIYMDIETTGQMQIPRNQLYDAIKAFRETIKQAGYRFGIYGSEYNLYSRISYSDFLDDIIWVAHYGKAPAFDCDIWQRSDSGSFPGYNGPVDTDEVMSDRMKAIIKGENNAAPTEPESPTIDPVQGTFPPDASVLILQMVMQYNGYWNTRPDGYKSNDFFEAISRFIEDMKKC